MQKIDILGSYYTLAVGTDPFGQRHCPHDFAARVAAAAKAGFTGMGFMFEDLIEVTRTHSLADMKRILDDHGIALIELEWLADWYRDGEMRAGSDKVRRLLLQASEALGARHVKAGDRMNDVAGPQRLTEELARLGEEAMLHGATILFEILPAPFSQVGTLEAAVAMVQAVGLPNVGLTLDNLQMHFMGVSNAQITEKVAGIRSLSVEISDGFAFKPKNALDWMINKRLMPGDGEFDITGFLGAVRDVGYRGPVTVEVMNSYVRQLPLETAATLAYQKTRAAVDAVNWG